MFKKNTSQCILGLSYDNLIWSFKKTKVCGRTSPLLQLWDSFGFWHTALKPSHLTQKKKPEMIETVQPREKMPAGSNQATPSKKKGKHLQVSSNFLDFLEFSCYFVSRLVFGVLIYISIESSTNHQRQTKKRSPTRKTPLKTPKKNGKITWPTRAFRAMVATTNASFCSPLRCCAARTRHASALRLDILDEWNG